MGSHAGARSRHLRRAADAPAPWPPALLRRPAAPPPPPTGAARLGRPRPSTTQRRRPCSTRPHSAAEVAAPPPAAEGLDEAAAHAPSANDNGAAPPPPPGAGAAAPAAPRAARAAGSWRARFSALYRFTRPHTMLGTAVSVASVSALALGGAPPSRAAAAAAAAALAAALLMNVCIVGINQLYDVDIDAVNKPWLPLPAGDLSRAAGAAVVAATGAASLAVGAAAGSPPLLATLGGSLALGVAYSADLPLLRWKRWPVAAAGCILAVRALLVQLGFFFHMQRALGVAAPALTRPIVCATGFMLLFSVVIALAKDIPDVAGDAAGGVATLSVRLGPRRVLRACAALLQVAYAGAALAAALTPGAPAWRRALGAGGHAALGAAVAWRAARTDAASPASVRAAYMDLWRAFYAEYLLLPFFA